MNAFKEEQRVAQGCSVSPISFSVIINDLLIAVEQTGLQIQLSSGKAVGGMFNCVGFSDSKESLQNLINVVHSYCSKWRL